MRQDTNPTQDYRFEKKTLNIFTHVLKRAMEVKLYVSTYRRKGKQAKNEKVASASNVFFKEAALAV